MKAKLNGTEKVAMHYPTSVIHDAPITAANYKEIREPSKQLRKKMMRFKPSEIGLDNPLKIVNAIVSGVISWEEGHAVHCQMKRITALQC